MTKIMSSTERENWEEKHADNQGDWLFFFSSNCLATTSSTRIKKHLSTIDTHLKIDAL